MEGGSWLIDCPSSGSTRLHGSTARDHLSHRGMANCSPGPSRSINNTTASFGNLTRAWVWRYGGWTSWYRAERAGRRDLFWCFALALASHSSSAPFVSNRPIGTGGRATGVAVEERGTAHLSFFSVSIRTIPEVQRAGSAMKASQFRKVGRPSHKIFCFTNGRKELKKVEVMNQWDVVDVARRRASARMRYYRQ